MRPVKHNIELCIKYEYTLLQFPSPYQIHATGARAAARALLLRGTQESCSGLQNIVLVRALVRVRDRFSERNPKMVLQ